MAFGANFILISHKKSLKKEKVIRSFKPKKSVSDSKTRWMTLAFGANHPSGDMTEETQERHSNRCLCQLRKLCLKMRMGVGSER
jgi:hypothetical protein